MIQTIFFDVGGTLIQPNPSVGEIYAEVARRHGVAINGTELENKFRLAWKDEKRKGSLVDKAWWRRVVQTVFQEKPFSQFDVFFEDLYATFDDPSRWQVFTDVKPTLEKLRAKGVRLVVASNWDSRLPSLLSTLKLTPYFEKMFISFEMNIAKPDPRFFHVALSALKENPIQAMHVGDDPIEDIECAEKAGLRAYLIDRKKKPINSRMLSSLEDILLRI